MEKLKLAFRVIGRIIVKTKKRTGHGFLSQLIAICSFAWVVSHASMLLGVAIMCVFGASLAVLLSVAIEEIFGIKSIETFFEEL